MPFWIKMAAMIGVVVIWQSLLEVCLRSFGPRALRQHYETERAREQEALRNLARWKVIFIEGPLKFGVPLALGFILVDLMGSYYDSGYKFHWDMIVIYLVVFGIGGMWTGYRKWREF